VRTRTAVAVLGLTASVGLVIGGPLASAEAAPATVTGCADWSWSDKSDGFGWALGGGWLYNGPNNGCTSVYYLGSGFKLEYDCYVLNTNGVKWTHGRPAGSSVRGWYNSSDLSNGGSTIPC